MKKLFLMTFALLTSLVSMAQMELVLECVYESNQAYKTLIVINEDGGGEAMSIAGNKKCHYDLEVETMGEHVVILAKNASLSTWVDDIYIISGDDKCFVVSPGLSNNNCAKIDVEYIEDESRIAAKKREYGLTSYKGNANGSSSSSSRSR